MSELFDRLKQANRAYHNGEPIMTDDEFDALVAKWESETGRKWVDVQGVGADVGGTLVRLPMWMGSMDKVKEEKDIVAWQKRWKPTRIVMSDKLDGISCLLHWIPSRSSVKLYTRGNGTKGTDITPLINVMPSFQNLLKHLYKLPQDTLEYEYFIRGELIIPKSSWEAERTTIWSDYSNPRNTVAGLVSRKVSSHSADGLKALKRIQFVPFSFDTKTKEGMWNQMTKRQMYEWMRDTWGDGSTVWFQSMTAADGLQKETLSKILVDRRTNSPYEIDGIIVWDDSKFEPNTGGNPKRAFAFKMVMEDQKAETLVTDVEWNVSRTGVWKPVVLFEPVTIGGTRIGRATGNNAAWLQTRGIGIGSRICIVRSGDVIPKILEVIHRVDTDKLPMPPEGTWKWDVNRTDIITTKDHIHSVATQANYLVATLSIKGLSKRSLEKYVETHTQSIACLPFPQMFPLIATKKDWLKVDGIKEKSATNFVERTEEAWCKADTVTRLLSLGLLPRGIGKKQVESMKQKNILEYVIGVSSGMNASEMQMVLEGTDGWGATRISSMMSALDKIQKGYAWALRNTQHIQLNTSEDGGAPDRPSLVVTDELRGIIQEIGEKPFVLFTGFRKPEWESYLAEKESKTIIRALSGKHTSANTVVITKGAKSSSKVKKAEQQGMTVIRI